jgi:uncharacterized protein DUF3617
VTLVAAAGCGGAEDREMSANEVAAELRDLRIEPGLWRVTSEVTAARGANLPLAAKARIEAHRRVASSCVTPAEAARPEANFLRQQRDGHCGYRGFSLSGSRMRGQMRCAGGGLPGTVTTEMDGRYRPGAYELTMRMTSTGMPEGANMVIETRTIGRRVGACPPAAVRPSEGGSR